MYKRHSLYKQLGNCLHKTERKLILEFRIKREIKFFGEIYDEIPKYELSLFTSSDLINKVNGKTPSYQEALNNYDKKLINYNIEVFITSEDSEPERLKHAEKIYKIITFLREKELEKTYIRYDLSIARGSREFTAYTCNLMQEDIEKINNLNEVLPYFMPGYQ